MIYIPKYDREQIAKIERAINEVTGVDKDRYIRPEGRAKGIDRMARLAWIYFVYENTTIGVEILGDMVGRHYTGVVRAVALVNKWLNSKGNYEFEKQLMKQIDEKRKTF